MKKILTITLLISIVISFSCNRVKKSKLDYEIARDEYNVSGSRCDLVVVLKKEVTRGELKTLIEDLVYDEKRDECQVIEIFFYIVELVPIDCGYRWAEARWYSEFLGENNKLDYKVNKNSIDYYKKKKIRQAGIEKLKADSSRKVFLGFEIGESYSKTLNKITALKNLKKVKRYKKDSITFFTSMLFKSGSKTEIVRCKLRFYENQLMNLEINCKEREACDLYEAKYGDVYDWEYKNIDRILQSNGNDYSKIVYIYKWELRHINIIIEDYFLKYDHQVYREKESDIKIIYSDKITSVKCNDLKKLESLRIKKEEEDASIKAKLKTEQKRKELLEKFKKQSI